MKPLFHIEFMKDPTTGETGSELVALDTSFEIYMAIVVHIGFGGHITLLWLMSRYFQF